MQASNSLESSRLSTAFNHIHDAVFATDLNDRITFWNRTAERLYGWTAKDALGQVAHQLLETKLPLPLAKIKEILRARTLWEGELAHTARDRRPLFTLSRWILLMDAEGKEQGIVTV